jgi:hypothetical protein
MTTLQPHTRSPVPWFRQFWPWFLIAVPMWAVVMGIATVYLAVSTDDGLVVDDYYKQGLAINRVLERDRRAVQLGITARLRFEPRGGAVHVQLDPGASGASLPGRLSLRLLHPTRAHQDRVITLRGDGRGGFLGETPSIATASWHLVLESPDLDWRLTGRIALPDRASVTLGAGEGAAASHP